jgi:hypothetical protein
MSSITNRTGSTDSSRQDHSPLIEAYHHPFLQAYHLPFLQGGRQASSSKWTFDVAYRSQAASSLPLVKQTISHSMSFVAFCNVRVDLKERQRWVRYRASFLQVRINTSSALFLPIPIPPLEHQQCTVA